MWASPGGGDIGHRHSPGALTSITGHTTGPKIESWSNQSGEAWIADLAGAVVQFEALRPRQPLEVSVGRPSGRSSPVPAWPDPAVGLVDDPVSALDGSVQPKSRNRTVDVQSDLVWTYLLAGQDRSVVPHMVDRVAVKRGRPTEGGSGARPGMFGPH